MRTLLEGRSSVDAVPAKVLAASAAARSRATASHSEPQLGSDDPHDYVRPSFSEVVVAVMLSHGYFEGAGEVNIVLPEATSSATATTRAQWCGSARTVDTTTGRSSALEKGNERGIGHSADRYSWSRRTSTGQ